MKKMIILMAVAMMLAACEKPIVEENEDDDGKVMLIFSMTNGDVETRSVIDGAADKSAGTETVTRAEMGNYFTKLNVQLFDENGVKVFDKVKTQTIDDDDFGVMSLNLQPGRYYVVAVGHSSVMSASIKSTEVVQFTASDGEKLTDTFCHCSKITISGKTAEHELTMYRVGAMIQFCLKDESFPANFARFKMDYTGGSANFNPTTLEGITKSTQSENRATNGIHIYQAFTFPYLSATGKIKMTCTALDMEGAVIRQRTFDAIPVTRNRITTYTGKFFEDGDGVFTQSDFSFLIKADWDGENEYQFARLAPINDK